MSLKDREIAFLVCILIATISFLLVSQPQPIPAGLENWTGYFRAEVFLDNAIWPLRIQGNSMKPTFEDGDLVLAISYPVENLGVGDIAVFYLQKAGGRVVHRVISVLPNGVLTKGDANPSDDGETISQIEGRVIGTLFTSRW
ncbi:MAG: signal peptidase I [Candidatus Hadarchaeales archaeon]